MEKKSSLSIIFTFSAEEVENPYFELLFGALRNHMHIIEGSRPLILPLTRNIIANPEADILQLDWIYGFYMANRYTKWRIINTVITILRTPFFMLDLIIISLLPTSVVWTVHNKRHHEKRYPLIERVINEIAFWSSDRISVKCENARSVLVETYYNAKEEKISVVPDGNYISSYQNVCNKPSARDSLSIDDEKFVYLFFGLIRPYKGVPELIDAFDHLQFTDIELWIVGNPYTEEYKEKLAKKVNDKPDIHTEFEFVERDQVQYYMNAADVLVLPYRDILNSGSVHLGLSFALPIISPKIGCIPESVPDTNDLLYDPDDENALYHELKVAYQHPDLNDVREKNLQEAKRQSWDKTARKLESVYESMI